MYLVEFKVQGNDISIKMKLNEQRKLFLFFLKKKEFSFGVTCFCLDLKERWIGGGISITSGSIKELEIEEEEITRFLFGQWESEEIKRQREQEN